MSSVMTFIYDYTVGGLIRGCLSSSPSRTIKVKEDSEDEIIHRALDTIPDRIHGLEPTDFIRDVNKDNLVFLPTKVLQVIVSRLSPQQFFALSQTCVLLRHRMFNYCRIRLLRLKIEIVTQVEQISFSYACEGWKQDWKSLPEDILLAAPFRFQKMQVKLKVGDMNMVTLSAVTRLLKMIRHKGKDLRVECPDSKEWQVTKEQFDVFFKEYKVTFLDYDAQSPCLDLVLLPHIGQIGLYIISNYPLDYTSHDLNRLVHRNPELRIAGSPARVIINAILLHNEEDFFLIHHSYVYPSNRLEEKNIFEQWLRSNVLTWVENGRLFGFVYGSQRKVHVSVSNHEIFLVGHK